MSEDEKIEQSDAVEETTTEAPSPATGFQAKVTEFVENMINPSLASHGGWVEVSSQIVNHSLNTCVYVLFVLSACAYSTA